MRFQSLVEQSLEELKALQLLREPDDGAARRLVEGSAGALGLSSIDASSNDYLGLASQSVSRETTPRPGAAASRLIHGSTAEHIELEAELASWLDTESSLLFSSTYAANLGLISALGVAGTVILSDAANHASLIDGARLAKAEVRIIPHLDLRALEAALHEARSARAVWVATESYFSMDGDGPDLAGLRELCDRYDACLIIDEAHALGVFGPEGAGRSAEAGIRPDIVVGALGKAVGSHGGFVAGSTAVRRFLWNKARSFVFSTALSPSHTALTTVQVRRARSADQERKRVLDNARALRRMLDLAPLQVATSSFGPIVSVILGSAERALAAAARLRELGILAQAIRAPTVPVGGARLRLTVKATFSPEDVERLGRAVVEACRA